jgi:uncharacterized protein YdhG (YjbR/CyaY superfamily)
MKKAKSSKRTAANRGSGALKKETAAKKPAHKRAAKAAARKTSNRRSAAKSGGPKSVDEYLNGFPGPTRRALGQIRAAIRLVVPPATTEIISYRMPAFKLKRVLVWYAAFSNHCSLFPTAAVIAAFKDELKSFTTTKGTIHFPIDKPVPTPLIKKMVKARVERSEGK